MGIPTPSAIEEGTTPTSSKSGGAGPDAAGKWIEGDEEEAKDDLTEAEQKIFRRYDKKKKGYLTPQEFKAFLRDMRAIGISAEYLTTQENKGCCGKLVKLPGERLCSYVKHNHTLLTVVYGYGPYTTLNTSIFDRLMLVVIIFLYSVGLTCIIAQYATVVPYVYRVVFQSVIDVTGLVVINTIFALTHKKACHDCVRYLADITMGVSLLGVCFLLYTKAETLHQGIVVVRTFLPNWLAGRLTEVFKVAAVWALKVQYGSTKGHI